MVEISVCVIPILTILYFNLHQKLAQILPGHMHAVRRYYLSVRLHDPDPTSSGTFRDVVRVSMKSSDSEIASSVIFGSGGRGWPDVRIARINYCTNWRKVRSQMQ